MYSYKYLFYILLQDFIMEIKLLDRFICYLSFQDFLIGLNSGGIKHSNHSPSVLIHEKRGTHFASFWKRI